jgi:hypothetical protein
MYFYHSDFAIAISNLSIFKVDFLEAFVHTCFKIYLFISPINGVLMLQNRRTNLLVTYRGLNTRFFRGCLYRGFYYREGQDSEGEPGLRQMIIKIRRNSSRCLVHGG